MNPVIVNTEGQHLTVFTPIVDFSIKIAAILESWKLGTSTPNFILQGLHKYKKPCVQLTNALMEDITITIFYVTKQLCNLKSHKTTFPKSVPSCLINEIAEVAPAVALIMQTSLDLGRIPFSWKRH